MDVPRRVQQIERALAAVEDRVATLAEDVSGAVAASLEAVEFASDEAAEAALEGGLGAADFANAAPSGKTGYTAADVRALVEDEDDDGGAS